MRPRLKNLSAIEAGASVGISWDNTLGQWKHRGWVEYAESVAISSTSLDSFQHKLTLTTSSDMPAGIYRVSWHIVWATATTYSINTRLREGTNIVIEYQSRGSSSATWNQPSNAGSQTITFTAGVHTLDWYFRRNGGFGSVSCSNANIEMEWVGS